MKMLLVDDEAIVLKGIAAMIRGARPEWTVVGACESAEAALPLVQEHAPDVVISDIRMYDMSGIELAERIHETHPQTLVILLTGYADFGYAQQAVKLHVFDYLLKPAKKEDILECLGRAERRILQDRQAREQTRRLWEQATQDLPHLREKFLRDAAHGLLPLGGDMRREILRYGMQAERYQALCCGLRKNAEGEAAQGEGAKAALFKEQCEKAFSALGKLMAFAERPWQVCCVLLLQENGAAGTEKLRSCVLDFSQRFFGSPDWVCVGCGNEVTNAEALFDSYHQAEYAMQAAQKQNLPLALFAGMEQPAALGISSEQVQMALRYIDENFQRELSLKDVAKAVFLNPWYLSEIFKKQVGNTFSEYVQGKRLQYACDMLRTTNLKLYEVAYQSGFGDQAYFSALFKKTYGMPPKKYREENGKAAGG